MRRAAPAGGLLHLLRRHADEGGRGLAVLHGGRQRPHHQIRSRPRPAGHRVRLRRLHRGSPGEFRHASAGADLLPVRDQHALRRPDRGAVEPAAQLDPLQLPFRGGRRHAGAGSASVSGGARRGAAAH